MIAINLKPFKFLFFIFFCQFTFGQLANFTLNVTKTDETCTANGTLTFNVINGTVGATIVYSIYQLPNSTTPISVLNTNSFSGLVAGDYRVVATQSLGSLTSSQQQDVTIYNNIIPLNYQLSGNDEICGHDGKITVNVITGVAFQYEIFQGPVIKPLQASNIFTDLVAGQYQVRVFDSCGEGVVQTFTVQSSTAGISVDITSNIYIIDCNTSQLMIVLSNSSSSTSISYPINIIVSVHPPGGAAPINYTQTIISGAQSLTISQNIIMYANQNYTINVHVVDGCGNNFSSASIIANSNTIPYIYGIPISCNQNNIYIQGAVTAVLTNAPSNFPQQLPYIPPTYLNGDFYIYDAPVGNYVFTTTDICGVVRHQTFMVQYAMSYIDFLTHAGCGFNKGSIIGVSNLTSVILVAAPSAYSNTLPVDLSSNIVTGNIVLSDLPAGQYIFNIIDYCGVHKTKTVNVIGYTETTSVTILPHCGSFDINLHTSGNNYAGNPSSYFLQIYSTIANGWINPLNGSANGGITLSNNTINYNFAYTGTFRIIKQFYSDGNCENVIYQFDFTGQPKINDIYSFLCNNGTYDVLVDAFGAPPLQYRITKKNGLPFVVQNGNSSVFLGIPAAVYNFQVEDACGNILNSDFEVPRPFDFGITAQSMCVGQAGSLTVPNFSILHYEWWKDNNTSTILSTTNSLQFPSLNLATDAGVYHVRVQYLGNPGSCIDFTIDYTISTSLFNPNAGQDNAISYCGNQNQINLFSLLLGSYDSGGIWQEVTSSGMLVNNLWDATNVPVGTYNFKYKVNGLCGVIDESNVTISIKPIPPAPIASVDPIVCDLNSLNLYATTILNCTYNWTGPNGFTSSNQNPTLNSISSLLNGVYVVKAIQDGCLSSVSSVNVVVHPLPVFTLESQCANASFEIKATAVQNSFDVTNVSYNWSGPNGFTAVGNPLLITGGEKGLYYLTITDANGCSSTQSIHILNTLCEAPNVITPNNDEFNQSFDLSGFDVSNLQIFSRWGRLVYERNDYLQDWHGQNNEGGDLPDGTYFYFAKLKSGEEKRGWIQVLR